MHSAGVAVGIATDGAAGNNNQDLFEEMDLGAKLQKFGHMNPQVLSAERVVEMAAIVGARALAACDADVQPVLANCLRA
jgi:5-methylthioadenosine/S-adenosylhomocysteine deaminase